MEAPSAEAPARYMDRPGRRFLVWNLVTLALAILLLVIGLVLGRPPARSLSCVSPRASAAA
jgi:hypothetical protein